MFWTFMMITGLAVVFIQLGAMNPLIVINRLKNLALDAGVIKETNSST